MPDKLTTLSPAKNDARGEDAAVWIAQLDAERTARELVKRHLTDLRALLPPPARQARHWWPFPVGAVANIGYRAMRWVYSAA